MRVLALHGLRETPSTSPLTLAFDNVIAPPINPWHPLETWEELERIVESEKPDVVVGFSLGGFFASTIALSCPLVLFNPALDLVEMLKERKNPREELIQEYESLPIPSSPPSVLGIFATGDLRIGMRGLRIFKERWPEAEVRMIEGGHNLTKERFKKESGF